MLLDIEYELDDDLPAGFNPDDLDDMLFEDAEYDPAAGDVE